MRLKVEQKQKQGSKRPVVVVLPNGTKETIEASTPEELARKLGNKLKKEGVRSFRFKVNGNTVEVDAAEQWMPDLIRKGGTIEVIPIAEAGARWAEAMRAVASALNSFSLQQEETKVIEEYLKYRGAQNIRVIGNRVVFDIKHIPLKYIKKGSTIESIDYDPNKGLFDVHFELSKTGSQWVIVDIQPTRGSHPNWFPDTNWLCTGEIKLTDTSFSKLLDHVVASLEMGTERVSKYLVKEKSKLAKLLLGEEE